MQNRGKGEEGNSPREQQEKSKERRRQRRGTTRRRSGGQGGDEGSRLQAMGSGEMDGCSVVAASEGGGTAAETSDGRGGTRV